MKKPIALITTALLIATPLSAVTYDIEGLQGDEVKLCINTDPPGVRFWVNGDDVGETPLTLIYCTPGSFKVKGKMDGYKTVKGEAEIVAGETVTLDFTMEEGKPPAPFYSWIIIGTFSAALAVVFILKILQNVFEGS